MNKKKAYKYVLCLGHLCSDINQGALSAVLPFVIAIYNYDNATAAMLVTVSNLFGSIVQPIIGARADKTNNPWILPIGVFLAGGGMALTGVMHNFYGLCIAVIISGIGVALFHPQAAQLVNMTSDTNAKGKGVSIFSFGGSLGFTLGPILTSFSITTFGMIGTLVFFIPSLIFSMVSAYFMKDFKELKDSKIHTKKRYENNEVKEDQWGAFSKLCIVIFGKSIISNGMSTFLALYFIQVLGNSEMVGNSILSLYYGIGTIAVLLGGNLADKMGYQKLLRYTFMIFAPFLFLFTLTDNVLLAVLMLIPLSVAQSLSYSPLVVLGQEYLPNHTGFASGITLGLAVSIGAILCPILGWIADVYSLTVTLYTIVAVSIVCLIASCFLPEVKSRTLE